MVSENIVLGILLICILVIIMLLGIIVRTYRQLQEIQEILSDIEAGNFNRRLCSKEHDLTKGICYQINNIVQKDQNKIIQYEKQKKSYKSLMTSLSHDVKTPLTSLVGYLEAIETGIAEENEKDKYTKIAYEKAQRLKDFVESLFAWVKLDSGEEQFNFRDVDIAEETRIIITDWIVVWEKEGISYILDIPEHINFVNLDCSAYKRILNNLFFNIVKHSQATEITLTLEREDQFVKICISDNGKGIGEKDIHHIFERMYQCDRARTAGGSGLGLAITKELVVAHDGKIFAESTVGKGCKFILLFPLKNMEKTR